MDGLYRHGRRIIVSPLATKDRMRCVEELRRLMKEIPVVKIDQYAGWRVLSFDRKHVKGNYLFKSE
jgi:hypothetical protein